MLTSISESPVTSLRTNGLTSLTRINSGNKYNFLRSPSHYVSPRPIRIDTADIDVSATRFHVHRNHRIRSTSPEPAQKQQQQNDKDASNETTDSSAFMPRVDQNDPVQTRSTIKRDRNMVRLSTMRQRSQTHSNRSSRDSIEQNEITAASPKSSVHDNSSFRKSMSQESDEMESDTQSNVKKSWRDKFGDTLLTNTPKVARKTPGELILERHIIREKTNSLKVPLEPKPTVVRIPDNVTQQEITYLEPLIRKSIRRQSLINCPSFKDICKDISSDIRKEDDLNAGDLRRRASLILEQEAHIIAQLTTMRRPSADVTVDESIAEEPTVDENDEKTTESIKDDVEKLEDKSTELQGKSENVIVIKKKTKKKGGKLKHKITVTVEVDNPSPAPVTLDTNANLVPTNVDDQPSDGGVGGKTSPTWRAVVEDIEEDVTLNLPKKSPKKSPKSAHPLKKCETEEDFWHLLGRCETINFKKKVDLKRNEIEIIEILENDEEQVADADAKKSVAESGTNSSPQNEKCGLNVATTTSNGKTPTDINIKANEIRQENVGNKMLPKKNVKNDNKPVDGVKTIASKSLISAATTSTTTTTTMATAAAAAATPKAPVEKRPTKSENALGNKETIAKPMEIKPVESSGTVEKTAPTTSPINVENVTTVSNETPCHKHKQTEKTDVKAPTMMQTVDLNLETGPQANEATKTEQLEKPTPTPTSTSTSAQNEKQKQIISTMSTSESPIKAKSDKSPSASDSNVSIKTDESSDKKPKLKKVAKKIAGDKEMEAKPKPKKKLIKKAAADRKLQKLKSVSSIESEMNAESTDADTSATSESIALTEAIEPKLSDRGNDNESNKKSIAGASQTFDTNPFDKYEPAGDAAVANSGSVGGLTKFATVANLNADDFEIERKSPSIDLQKDHCNSNDKSTFSTRSIADSCISGDEQIDLLVDLFSSDSDKYSDSESEDEMGQKRRHKKRKEKLDTRKVMKLDPKRKCYITDEAAKYPMIATPRPLAKRSNYCQNYGESESESETSSDLCSSDECYDECLSPNDVVVKDVIRMSTCSNDSGFDGGGTAPSSPKKMLGKCVWLHKHKHTTNYWPSPKLQYRFINRSICICNQLQSYNLHIRLASITA